MTQPILGAMPLIALTFVIMEQSKALLTTYVDPEMSMARQCFFGGAVSGGGRLVISVPVELLKTRA